MDMDPVTIWQGLSTTRTISRVDDAALFLLHRWPADHINTPAAREARMRCLAALDGSGTVGAFRAAFLFAAEEADMLAPELPTGRKLAGHVARPWNVQKKR